MNNMDNIEKVINNLKQNCFLIKMEDTEKMDLSLINRMTSTHVKIGLSILTNGMKQIYRYNIDYLSELRYGNNSTVYMIAAYNGNIDFMVYLEKKRYCSRNFSACDNNNKNALHYAIKGRQLNIVKHLIDNKIIVVNKKDTEYYKYACMNGTIEILEYLGTIYNTTVLEKNCCDTVNGETTLYDYALLSDNPLDIIKYLSDKKNFFIYSVDSKGKNLYDSVLKQELKDKEEILKYLKEEKLFCELNEEILVEDLFKNIVHTEETQNECHICVGEIESGEKWISCKFSHPVHLNCVNCSITTTYSGSERTFMFNICSGKYVTKNIKEIKCCICNTNFFGDSTN